MHQLGAPFYRPSRAQTVLSEIGARNADLNTYKGIGNVRLKVGEITQSARLAWMGLYPGHLRLELLGSGHPLAKLAYDGERLYLVSHADGRFYSRRGDDPDLAGFIPMDLPARDLIALLAARIPIPDFHFAELRQHKEGWALELKRWAKTKAILYLDSALNLQRLERYNVSEKLMYRAEVLGTRNVDGHEIYSALRLTGPDRIDQIEIDLDRYWANVPVSTEKFILKPAPETESDPAADR